MSLLSRLGLLFPLLGVGSLSAQIETIVRPSTTTPFSRQMIPPGGAAVPIDLKHHFTLANEEGDKFAQFDTVYGKFNVVLKGAQAPVHVANFLRYVNEGAYNNTFFHRTIGGSGSQVASIAQAGGFRLPYSTQISSHDPIALEGPLAHEIYTLAAARTSVLNSATNQFFFNLVNNSGGYFPGGGPGDTAFRYTVYGRAVGSGGVILNKIGLLPVYNLIDGSVGTQFFETVPLRDKVPGILTEKNLVTIHSIKEVPLYPEDDEPSVLTFTAQSSNPEVARVSLSGSTLSLVPGTVNGVTLVTVRVSEAAGDYLTAEFEVETNSDLAIARAPRDHIVTEGDAVLLDVIAVGAGLSFQWQHEGEDIAGATFSSHFIGHATPEDAGNYTVVISNAIGTLTSPIATLTVVDNSPAQSQLTNLSVRSFAGSGEATLIAGFVAEGEVDLAMRGIGPTLAEYDVANVLEDPELTLYSSAPSHPDEPIDSNDDWVDFDGSAWGGFALPASSKDAVLKVAKISGGNTVHVSGVGNTSGEALIELYEGPSSVGELINLSARTEIKTQAPLIGGFTLTGSTSRTVLIRAVGPSLKDLVPHFFQDPRLTLYSLDGTLLEQNDNWSGSAWLKDAFDRTGAFSLDSDGSKDAVILVTLPPGGYTAHITGPAGHTGVVLLEVYLVR